MKDKENNLSNRSTTCRGEITQLTMVHVLGQDTLLNNWNEQMRRLGGGYNPATD